MDYKSSWVMLAGVFFSLCSSLVTAQDKPWSYSAGIDYSTGNYGSDVADTTVTYLPFSVFYRGSVWDFGVSLAHLTVEGTGSFLPGEGNVRGVVLRGAEIKDLESQVTTESGIGDIWLSASRFISAVPPELFYLDLGVKMKIPTADKDKGLGTGVSDYVVEANFYQSIGGATPFFTLSYKARGEADDYDLNNVIAASLGSDFTLSERRHFGFSLDFQEESYDDGESYLEIFGYFKQDLTEHWALMMYGYSGLEDGSPDYGLGMQVLYAP